MKSNPPRSALTLEEIRMVSPALEKYTQIAISDNLWTRPDLSPLQTTDDRLWLESLPGAGSTFYFSLAASARPSAISLFRCRLAPRSRHCPSIFHRYPFNSETAPKPRFSGPRREGL